VLTLANLYQVLGRIALSPILVISFPVVLLSCMKIFASYDDDSMLWYAFPVSGILVFLFAFVVSEVIRLRNRQAKLMPLTLLPTKNYDQVYEVSLKNTTDDFYKTIGELQQIVGSFKLDETTKNQAVSSTEELLINTIRHSGIEGNNHYSDLRMVQTEEKFTVSMKYEGKPFNPITADVENRKFGLRIMFGLSEAVDYKYMYGQNMMYLSWNLNQKTNK
jgi:anti-sigma regulatory factor (Ser/Thr protein kinase)